MTDAMRFAITACVAAALSAGWMIAAAIAGGFTLDFWLAGLVAVTILLPPLVLQVRGSIMRECVVAGCITDTIAIAWLAATLRSDPTVLQWLVCYALLCALAAALWGIARMLARWMDPVVAAAVTVALGLAWLTCPIWLAHTNFTGYIAVHPLFALNSVLRDLGIWTESGLPYRKLVNLGQDAPYMLPPAWWAIVAHFFVGLVAGCVAVLGTSPLSSSGAMMQRAKERVIGPT